MRIHHLITIATIVHATAKQHPFDVLEPVLTPDLTEIVQGIVDAYQIPGLSLAVVRKNGHSEFGSWGKRSEDGSRVTEDTLFNIGSCSKAFVAASLGILIEEFAQGRNTTPLPATLSTLSWRTKLTDILPGDWELSDTWASKKANLIDILTHVSGMPSHDFSYKQNHSTLDLTQNLRNLRPSRELREKFIYNNQMYMVGAHVIATLSGVPFEEFVKDRILKPLRMTRSTYSIDEAIQSGEASETWTPFGRRIPSWMEGLKIELLAGPGGLISNVKELASWVKLFLNNGVDLDTNATIIPHGTFETMTSAHSILFGSLTKTELSDTIIGYGLGWARFSVAGHDLLHHTGGAPGVSAHITIPVFDGVGVVVLANADSKHPGLSNIAFVVLRKLAGYTDESMPAYLSARPWTRFPSACVPITSPCQGGLSTTNELPPSRLDLTGTYDNIGYGAFTLCNASSRSDECRLVLRDFRLVDESSMRNPNRLFGAWPTVWTSHAQFDPTNTPGRYLVEFGTLYPAGYGKNTTPFAHGMTWLVADFVVEDGIVRGVGFNGIGEREWSRSKPVEENFDVWFRKRV